MFTGLIRDIGQVVAVSRTARDATLTLEARQLDAGAFALGASVACSGVCLTVVERAGKRFVAEVSAETLEKTTVAQWAVGTRLNLEPSLRVGDELGGHLVYGHVDAVGQCTGVAEEGACWRLRFSVPPALAPFIAAKGSVAIDGVSLTVNAVEGNHFGVMIVPHTFTHTTFAQLAAGSVVNIEIDMLARYVARLQNYSGAMP